MDSFSKSMTVYLYWVLSTNNSYVRANTIWNDKIPWSMKSHKPIQYAQ